MNKQMMGDFFHDLSLTGLMFLNLTKLFHKINALPWYRETLQTWSDGLGYQHGSTILEVGCATGILTKYLAGRGAIAVGMDGSARMFQKANETKVEGAYFEHASALDLPFECHRFDYIISASLINIISKPELALSEMVRVCKPGGKISVLVPQAGISDEAVSTLDYELDLTGFSRAALFAWHHRAPKMQRERLLEIFKNEGLNNVCIDTKLNGMVMTVTGTC